MFAIGNSTSWCEKVVIASACSICVILGLDYKFTVLPFHGVYLIAYLIFIIVATTWITFICLQNLLQHNKPFKYDLEKNAFLKYAVKLYQYLYDKESQGFESNESAKPAGDSGQCVDVPDSKVFQAPLKVEKRQAKNIDDRIDEFVRDIEARFILKWYVHISNDPTFPSECKVLLDEIVRRFLQVIVQVDSRKLMYGCIVVFLKHVKEFRKAVKRSQRNDGAIEELYRYSHTGSKSAKATDHFVFHLTTNVLRQFINWELWSSLPCRALVLVLSRRFTAYILTYISSPGFLNYKIVQMCAAEATREKLKLDRYSFISVSDVDHAGSLKQLQQQPSGEVKEKDIKSLKIEDSSTPTLTPRKVARKIVTPDYVDGKQFDAVDSGKNPKVADLPSLPDGTTSKDPKVTPSKRSADTATPKVELRPKASEPVKIYESKSASKTWRNSSDLECISLGQDLLAFQEFNDPDSQIQELIEKKLWKDSTDPVEDDKATAMWDIPESWYKEEEVVDAVDASPPSHFQSYLKSTANTASYITNTIKPIGNVTASTLHNMKELQQTTVNTVNTVVKPMSQATTNAMHKIGDLQDEAAGVVEGIFDFGMAGLRKGLRLTGLQENFSELAQKAKSEFQRPDAQRSAKGMEASKAEKDAKTIADAKSKSAAKLIKTPHVASEDKVEQVQSSSDSEESVWINQLAVDSPSFDGHILLERTPDSVSNSSIVEKHKPKDSVDFAPRPVQEIPLITKEILAEDSPDLEYEEPQDFASTIAKLRTLLQQKSSESGFTTPALSPLPQDDISKTPADPPPADLTKVDGAMPSLYKLCARTATGVFQNTLNTIKTALPGNVNEAASSSIRSNVDDWTFIEADSTNDNFHSRMKKLLSERRAFCTVDTAYEAIDSLETIDQPDLASWSAVPAQFDDELDEFDLQVPITKALVDVASELIGDSDTYLLQESVIKTLLLLVGNYIEELVTKQSDSLLHTANKFVGKLPENISQEVMSLKLGELVQICMEAFPKSIKVLLGEVTIEAGIKLFLTSLQSHRINKDVSMQMFELFASELINACSQVSPTYSA